MDNMVIVENVVEGSTKAITLTGWRENRLALAFTPDDKYILVNYGSTLRVYDISSAELVKQIELKIEDTPKQIEVGGTGKLAVSTDYGIYIGEFDITKKSIKLKSRMPDTHGFSFQGLKFIPNTDKLAFSSSGFIGLIDLKDNNKIIWREISSDEPYTEIGFSPSGSHVAYGGNYSKMLYSGDMTNTDKSTGFYVFDTKDGKRQFSKDNYCKNSDITGITLNADGSRVLVTGGNNIISVYDNDSGREWANVTMLETRLVGGAIYGKYDLILKFQKARGLAVGRVGILRDWHTLPAGEYLFSAEEGVKAKALPQLNLLPFSVHEGITKGPEVKHSEADTPELKVLYEQATNAMKNAQYELAVEKLTRIFELQPNNADATFGLGLVYQELNNPEQAINYYLKTLTINPEDFNARNNIGLTYLKAKNYSEAIKIFEEVVIKKPLGQKQIAYVNLAACYEAMNNQNSRKEYLEKSIADDPTYAHGLASLAYFHYQNNEKEKAIELWRSAIEKDAGNGRYYKNLGKTLEEQGKNDEAEKVYIEGVNQVLAERDNELGYAYGEFLFFVKEDYNKSLKYFLAELDQHPDSEVWEKIAIVYSVNKDYKALALILSKVSKYHGEEPKHYYYRGIVQYYTGDKDYAFNIWRNAAKRGHKESIDILDHFGKTY
jgi:tetratricopeptide (TPR) repeat protein